MKKECCNLNEVVQEFYNYLHAYLLKKVKDQNLADDLVQEVMVQLVESHQKDVEVKNIKAWLFQVSRNTLYDYFKKNKLEVTLEDDWQLEQLSTSNFSKILVSDYVIPMIQMLPKNYSVPLKLSDVDNIPQKQIAEQLNLGLSTTKMRIQRGRQKLKALFVECCDIEYDKDGNFVHCTIKENCTPLQNTFDDFENNTLTS